MALVLNNLKKVDMPLNKKTKTNQTKPISCSIPRGSHFQLHRYFSGTFFMNSFYRLLIVSSLFLHKLHMTTCRVLKLFLWPIWSSWYFVLILDEISFFFPVSLLFNVHILSCAIFPNCSSLNDCFSSHFDSSCFFFLFSVIRVTNYCN